jgi:hypothetical protein
MPKTLRDAQGRGDIPKTHTGIARDADEDPGVIGEKAPFAHGISLTYSGTTLLVYKN